jgi:hypothetical protein
VLDCNQIEALPHWLPELVSLRELWIQDNPIAPPLPRQLDEMVQLRRLVVDRPLEKEARQVLTSTKNSDVGWGGLAWARGGAGGGGGRCSGGQQCGVCVCGRSVGRLSSMHARKHGAR